MSNVLDLFLFRGRRGQFEGSRLPVEIGVGGVVSL